MEFMVIENSVEKIKKYNELKIDRIFIDLETLGKNERQGHLDTVKSDHSIKDIRKAKEVSQSSLILVRVNPINPNSEIEIENCIESGCDIIMLPYFKTAKEVSDFIDIVGGRVKTSILLETAPAFFRLEEILEVGGIDEIHIGLNDLHLSLGLDFMFEIYSSPYLEIATKKITEKGISLGIGGVAPASEGLVSGRNVIIEAKRLGAERLILSRAFPKDNMRDLEREVDQLRNIYHDDYSEEDFLMNREQLQFKVREVVALIRKKKSRDSHG